MRYFFIYIVIAALGLQACESSATQSDVSNKATINKRPMAKFEPQDGKVILFVGQELESVGGLDDYHEGYLDYFDKPGGWTTYSNINPGETSFGRVQEGLDGIYDTHDWGDSHYNASLQIADKDFEHMALAIGLQFVNHEHKVANGTHDQYIHQLADFLLSLGRRPVFLRIAYEFDGDPWNHYNREATLKAYRRIVDMLREKGVNNTAYVWQSTGFVSNQEQLAAWYPGDDYVDWCGFSFFNRWKEQEMIAFARKKGKPVFIAEASPTISDFGAKFTGQTKATILGNKAHAEEAWEKWFVPFFNTIDQNPDVVKAVSYINCNWRSHPMWVDNPTFQKVDARLQTNAWISQQWRERTRTAKYLKASPELFALLYGNKSY